MRDSLEKKLINVKEIENDYLEAIAEIIQKLKFIIGDIEAFGRRLGPIVFKQFFIITFLINY